MDQQITLWAFGQQEVAQMQRFIGTDTKKHEDGSVKSVSVTLMKRKDVAAIHKLNPKKDSAKLDEIMLGLQDATKSAAMREISGVAAIAEWTAPVNGALRKSRSKKGQESISLRLVKIDRKKGMSLEAGVAAMRAKGMSDKEIVEYVQKHPAA